MCSEINILVWIGVVKLVQLLGLFFVWIICWYTSFELVLRSLRENLNHFDINEGILVFKDCGFMSVVV